MKSKKNKRILLVWNGMAARQVSGGDIYVEKLIRLSQDNFDIVASTQASDLVQSNAVKRRYITDVGVAAGTLALSWLYLKRSIKAWRFISKNKTEYDGVLASSPFMPDILPALRKRTDNRAVIFFHLIPDRKGHDFRTKLRFFVARAEQKLSLLIIKRYFHVILAGNVVVQAELQKRFPNKKIVIAHAGINTKKIDDVTVEKKDNDLAVFVGRLTTQKGILDLVEVTKIVTKKHPAFRLVIVGEGQDKNLLLNKIDQLGVKNIEMKGFVSEKEKYQLTKKAAFFLFPSYEEGWGIALAEGLYAGAKTVCYELPHYRSIFKDYPLYVPLGDTESFARVVLDHYTSSAQKNQIKFTAKYDDKKVVDDVMRAIN